MKHIRIICFVALLASMSSCSVFRQTSTNRTARSLEIEADIQQMPTVADLIVDTTYVRHDTTWTNIPFKSHSSKAAMREVLLGIMLEDNNADVIIQPREHVRTDVYHPFKQTYRMEIYGYPARYRNFRTATEEDLRILNGLDPQPVNYNTIYIGSGSGFQKPTLQAADAMDITPAVLTPKKEKKPAYVRKNFITTIDVGYDALFYKFRDHREEAGHGFQINASFLWKGKDPHMYSGVGLGLNSAFSSIYSYYGSREEVHEWYIPMYFQWRSYFVQRRCTPFFDFRLGAFMGGLSEINPEDRKEKDTAFGGGMYAAAFIGVEFGKHFNISLGTDQYVGAETNYGFLYVPSFAVRLGFNF